MSSIRALVIRTFARNRCPSCFISGAKVGMKSKAANGDLTQRSQRHGGRRVGDEFPPGDDTREVGRVWFVRMNRFWRVLRLGVLNFFDADNKDIAPQTASALAENACTSRVRFLRDRYLYFILVVNSRPPQNPWLPCKFHVALLPLAHATT